jgi:hypothetical protein
LLKLPRGQSPSEIIHGIQDSPISPCKEREVLLAVAGGSLGLDGLTIRPLFGCEHGVELPPCFRHWYDLGVCFRSLGFAHAGQQHREAIVIVVATVLEFYVPPYFPDRSSAEPSSDKHQSLIEQAAILQILEENDAE